jgi:AraC-like DNA-binding protein
MDKEAVSDIDKEFLKKFFSIIRGKLSDCDLNVEEIGREIGYSRVQLYRKIKALTNYSPVELLRIERLKKADSMLHSTDEPISVICYSVGFSSPSYFTKCYKAQYGISPSEIQR